MPNLTPADWAEVELIREWTRGYELRPIRPYTGCIHLLLRALDELRAERDALKTALDAERREVWEEAAEKLAEKEKEIKRLHLELAKERAND